MKGSLVTKEKGELNPATSHVAGSTQASELGPLLPRLISFLLYYIQSTGSPFRFYLLNHVDRDGSSRIERKRMVHLQMDQANFQMCVSKWKGLKIITMGSQGAETSTWLDSSWEAVRGPSCRPAFCTFTWLWFWERKWRVKNERMGPGAWLRWWQCSKIGLWWWL